MTRRPGTDQSNALALGQTWTHLCAVYLLRLLQQVEVSAETYHEAEYDGCVLTIGQELSDSYGNIFKARIAAFEARSQKQGYGRIHHRQQCCYPYICAIVVVRRYGKACHDEWLSEGAC